MDHHGSRLGQYSSYTEPPPHPTPLHTNIFLSITQCITAVIHQNDSFKTLHFLCCRRYVSHRTADPLEEWDGDGCDFLCPVCVLQPDTGVYDVVAALKRVVDVAEKPRAQIDARVKTEKPLLQSYGVSLPDKHDIVSVGPTCKVSSEILEKLSHPALVRYKPLCVVGYGNCMYRAICRAHYSHDNFHQLIRLLTALEMAENPEYYDDKREDYHDMITSKIFPQKSTQFYLNIQPPLDVMQIHHTSTRQGPPSK